MRRLRFILGVVLLALSVPSLAQSQVESVRIDVALMDDGSAFVKEVWEIDVSDDEPLENLTDKTQQLAVGYDELQ